ncbi:MAG: hypothetical protein DRR16_08395 [Candidatus Parabeggiatoa sp. nov. 3]|jgi:hypothetical protein|nr:MAG: hypothetical protein DRR00_18745 [Gammaproteobacteria bacterium]RKZ60731.1 MAG: hypothetical protein DRQ99_21585 [Gammaproteobacteria bacterium]RKZ86945.1 MAG: hypothetical protein DRR16_08395 [Gammaproteobacteria bacterium]HEW97084.1 hypothetical protein [Beggiatoa sp.]
MPIAKINVPFKLRQALALAARARGIKIRDFVIGMLERETDIPEMLVILDFKSKRMGEVGSKMVRG